MKGHFLRLVLGITLGVAGTAEVYAASYSQATISGMTFYAVSLTGDPASYRFLIDPSYPYTTPTTVGATAYDLDYFSPGGYDTKYVNSYSLFANVAVTATSHQNQAYAASGVGILTSWASSFDQISSTSTAASGSFVSPGKAGLEVSPNSVLFVAYDVHAVAIDQGLPVSPSRPFESAYAFASFSFYGETGTSWLASDTVLVGAGTNANNIADTITESGHYVSWIANYSDAPLLAGLDIRTHAEAYGGGIAPVPEPETWLMLSVGIGLLGVSKRKAGLTS